MSGCAWGRKDQSVHPPAHRRIRLRIVKRQLMREQRATAALTPKPARTNPLDRDDSPAPFWSAGEGRPHGQGSGLALSWSGGKDSALALWVLRRELGLEPQAPITTVTEGYERISMHGVRRALLHRQAVALALPVAEVLIPPECTNQVYDTRMSQGLASAPLRGVGTVAFGDLFLQDVRRYREQRLRAAAKTALFPL